MNNLITVRTKDLTIHPEVEKIYKEKNLEFLKMGMEKFGQQHPIVVFRNESKIEIVDGISSSSSVNDKPGSHIDTSDNHKRQSTLLRDSISSIGRTLKAFHADRSVMKDNSNINDDVNDDEGETYQNDKTITAEEKRLIKQN